VHTPLHIPTAPNRPPSPPPPPKHKGTFTISNGGVYGSLFGTPIINPPQSAILGMHSIVQVGVVGWGLVGSRLGFFGRPRLAGWVQLVVAAGWSV
jgi:hypothetical protein